MRWYVVDDLSAGETARLAQALRDMEFSSGVDSLYWLPVPENLLSPVQRKHAVDCGPHALGLELEEHSLRLELLVRARGRLRCDCVHYAGPELRARMIAYLDQLMADLQISA
ncbi:hypothetical protein [Desulfovibrio sp. SGI.169]|uniref:hypothetical protein n=1 Tax=Desulfovibrio sp. SGI.169 TaxID=3420561 RepID=UPI003D006270